MEIQFYGANCVRITSKKANIVVDDLDGTVAKAGDIAVFTGPYTPLKTDVKHVIDQPGEYEVADISIVGIAAQAHMDEAGKKLATMYQIIVDDVRIGVLGHIYPDLSDAQLETLGVIDVLTVPVGGSGYTLDGIGALKVIKKIDPKIIIPTHYADTGVTYEVPQASLEDALKGLAMEPKETVPKLKLKGGELLGESNQLIVLEKQ